MEIQLKINIQKHGVYSKEICMENFENNTCFVIATKNQDKVHEIKEILKDLPFRIISMEEAGIHEDIEEDGETFCENALKKATEVHKRIGGYVMADDSGLSIDALGGAPGIYSARFHGKDSTYPEKIRALWDLLSNIPLEQRTAHFICAIAVIRPDGSFFTVQESMDGILYDKIVGENGFGYDPVFFLPEKGVTAAQLTNEEKNAVSHRGKALRVMLAQLRNT
jgi:XTP/dITP diphosphohydrolase